MQDNKNSAVDFLQDSKPQSDVTRADRKKHRVIGDTHYPDESLAPGMDATKKTYKDLLKKGFDLNDPLSFDLDYTVLGRYCISLIINDEYTTKAGIILPSAQTDHTGKALILKIGNFVQHLREGDIVSLKPGAFRHTNDKVPGIMIKDIKFSILNEDDILGIFGNVDLKQREEEDASKV